MSIFSKPDVPKPVAQANAPITASAAELAGGSTSPTPAAASLISTSAAGLTRKPKTQKTSLIGGA